MTSGPGALVVGWEHVAVLCVFVVLAAGVMVMVARGGTPTLPLGASLHDYGNLQSKVQALERQFRGLPTKGEIVGLGERVGGLEVGITAVRTQIAGVRESNARVERMVEMLTQAALKGTAQ